MPISLGSLEQVTVHPLPTSGERVILPTWEPGIIGRSHDVAQPDADDLGSRIPSAELLAHLLAHEL